MGDFALIFGGLVNGLPFLISHFVTSVIVFLIGVISIFSSLMKNSANKKKYRAAISFSGALIGMALPLASSLSASNSFMKLLSVS